MIEVGMKVVREQFFPAARAQNNQATRQPTDNPGSASQRLTEDKKNLAATLVAQKDVLLRHFFTHRRLR